MKTTSNKGSRGLSHREPRERQNSAFSSERQYQRQQAVQPIPNMEEEEQLGNVFGSATGEADRDVLPGGWEGTDDASSTAPSDLSHPLKSREDTEHEIDRLWGESQITGATFSEDDFEA